MCIMDSLIEDIQIQIFIYSDVNGFCSCMRVCKKWKTVIDSPKFWRLLFATQYPTEYEPIKLHSNIDWKALYIENITEVRFHPEIEGPAHTELSNNRRTFSHFGPDNNLDATARNSWCYPSNKKVDFYCEVTIDKSSDVNGVGVMFIGFLQLRPEDPHIGCLFNSAYAWSYSVYEGSKRNKGYSNYQHTRCTIGETIGVLLNQHGDGSASISYFKNGEPFGVAFDHIDISEFPIYFAVNMAYDGCQVTVKRKKPPGTFSKIVDSVGVNEEL